MARSQASAKKKENEKKRVEKRKQKEQRREERKATSTQGKSLEDMMAYVDENGNISATPPDPSKRKVIQESEIILGSRNIEGSAIDRVRKGRVTYFNTAKGYGFIKDLQSQESIFVHANSLTFIIKENDNVSFETERSIKGLNAINVVKKT